MKVWGDKAEDEEYEDSSGLGNVVVGMEISDPSQPMNPNIKRNLTGKRVRVTRFNRGDVDFEATLQKIGKSYYMLKDAEIEEYNDSLLYIETHPEFGKNNVDYYELVEHN